MSLYNLLFGRNAFAPLLLEILGTTEAAIPRYRDCFLNEAGEIVIHTRTGGGNRDAYERGGDEQQEYNPDGPFNDDLRNLPGYVGDEDDDFDSTYANFRYTVSEAVKPQIDLIKVIGGVQNPAERWAQMLDNMRSGNVADPQVKRALEVGERILDKMFAHMPDADTSKGEGIK